MGLVLVAFLGTDPSLIGECETIEAPLVCFEANDTVYFVSDGEFFISQFVAVGFWFLMGAIVQGKTGATPGKRMLGLRVVDAATGQIAGIGKASARTAMWVADAIPFLFPLVGLITGVATKGHRRVGDMVAGTLVVHKTSVGTAPIVPGLPTAGAPVWAPGPPGGFVAPPPASAALPKPPVVDVAPVSTPRPEVAPIEPPAAETAPDDGDGIDTPKWDAARSAYIQWDKEQQKWMTYDDTAAAWKPLL